MKWILVLIWMYQPGVKVTFQSEPLATFEECQSRVDIWSNKINEMNGHVISYVCEQK